MSKNVENIWRIIVRSAEYYTWMLNQWMITKKSTINPTNNPASQTLITKPGGNKNLKKSKNTENRKICNKATNKELTAFVYT